MDKGGDSWLVVFRNLMSRGDALDPKELPRSPWKFLAAEPAECGPACDWWTLSLLTHFILYNRRT